MFATSVPSFRCPYREPEKWGRMDATYVFWFKFNLISWNELAANRGDAHIVQVFYDHGGDVNLTGDIVIFSFSVYL